MQHYMLWGSLYRIQGSTSLCSIPCYGAHYIEFKALPLYAVLLVKGLTIYNSRLYLFMQYYLSWAHYIEFKALPLYAVLLVKGLTIYNSRLYPFMQHYMLWGSLYRIQGSTSLCSITCQGAHYIEFKALPLYATLHVMGLTI